jgi:hypothetical protein
VRVKIKCFKKKERSFQGNIPVHPHKSAPCHASGSASLATPSPTRGHESFFTSRRKKAAAVGCSPAAHAALSAGGGDASPASRAARAAKRGTVPRPDRASTSANT